jgi:hypothetical protein
MEEEIVDALNFTVAIDFTAPDGLVDPFETIIRYPCCSSRLMWCRYMGGILSTIDLLESGLGGVNFDSQGLLALRKQAETLAKKLSPGSPPS